MHPVKQPAAVRRRQIAELVTKGEFLRPADIAIRMAVSAETVRRDLMALEQSGELKRIHGGVMAAGALSDVEPSRSSRSMEARGEKEQIAARAASLIGQNDTVFLDVGTTIEALASFLAPSFKGTVVTNSLVVGSILGDRAGLELHVLGGRVRIGELTTYGPEVLAQIRSFNADCAFLGVGGLDVAAGFTDYASEDVPTKQLMIEQATRTYVLATSYKLGRVASRHVCDLDRLAGLITDGGADRATQEALQAAGLTVLVGA